jgi:hypothetical protein
MKWTHNIALGVVQVAKVQATPAMRTIPWEEIRPPVVLEREPVFPL